MRRLHFHLFIFILGSLLIGCVPKAAAQPADVRALENSTPMDVLKKSTAASAEPELISRNPPANCPVTVAQDPPFTAPDPYSRNSPFDSNFWYGSKSLWTDLPKAGIWYALHHTRQGYTQKMFWWSEWFSFKDEPQPVLVVFGRRLDEEEAPPLIVSRATNASAGDIGTAMLVGVDFPTLGCWKITGQYKKSELSFVVWVAP